MSTTTSFAEDRPMFDAYRNRIPQLMRQSAYLVIGFPLAIAAFVALITGFALGVGTAVIWIGLPILVGTLHIAGVFAALERRSAAMACEREMPTPAYLPAPRDRGAIAAVLGPLRDTQRWLDLLWGVVHFMVATITFCFTITWWVGAFGTVLGPLTELILNRIDGIGRGGLGTLLGFDTVWANVVIDVLLGLVFVATLPAVVNALATMQSSVSHALLCMRGGYEQRIDDLNDSRSAARDAEVNSLRRLERDIHDGPQQRLIRLQMDLARAERAAQSDPERAMTLLAEARSQAHDTLVELRNLSRSVAPPVLVDRGLDAALEDLVARSDVPATLGTETRDLPPAIATAAYFVVAEALANVNKHSLAAHARVDVIQASGLLTVTISDDGVGGASPAKGHGLAGLTERLRGVDGHLSVDSPAGGPTVVEAVIPCGS